MAELPIPVTDDVDTSGFWVAASEGTIAVRVCTDCGAAVHLPRQYCSRCRSWNTGWRTVRPTGTLYSWTTTYRELRPGFVPPFTVVLVALDDFPDVKLMGYLPGEPELTSGQAMVASFETRGETTIPQWQPR